MTFFRSYPACVKTNPFLHLLVRLIKCIRFYSDQPFKIFFMCISNVTACPQDVTHYRMRNTSLNNAFFRIFNDTTMSVSSLYQAWCLHYAANHVNTVHKLIQKMIKYCYCTSQLEISHSDEKMKQIKKPQINSAKTDVLKTQLRLMTCKIHLNERFLWLLWNAT